MENLDTFAPDVNIQETMAAPAETTEPVNEAPEPEQKAAEAPNETPEAVEEKKVNLGALHEARRREREYRDKYQELEKQSAERFAALEKRLEDLKPKPEVPTFEENPAEHLRVRTEEIAARQKAFDDARTAQESAFSEQAKQRQAIQSMTSEMERHEVEFRGKTPDYDAAISHLQAVSESNLLAMGITDAAERRRITYQQFLQLTANALDKGQDPAQMAYTFAKNYGYKMKVDETRKVKAMADGQSSTQNMGNGKADMPFDIRSLANMDDDEFDAAIANDANWRKIIRQT